MRKSVKIVVLLLSCLFLFVLVCGAGAFFYYNSTIHHKASSDESVTFVVEKGVSSKEIINRLHDADLIENKYVGYVYLKLHSSTLIQAGEYVLNRSMSFEEIMDTFSKGKVVDDSISITFVEGKRITYFVEQIANSTSYREEEIYAVLADKGFLKELIEKYWFLTDTILNDKLYYALEGYLYPNTYAFKKDVTIKDIICRLLDGMETYLSSYKEEFESSGKSVHSVLTMASIVELEGANSDDRKGVAGVFYNRLRDGWSLGSDVTTYYGARVLMSERELYQKEIDTVNDYNTRPAAMAGKLPIGPICNPGADAIVSSLEPEEHEYYYFVADKNKKTYFMKDYTSFIKTINDLKSQNLWYEY